MTENRQERVRLEEMYARYLYESEPEYLIRKGRGSRGCCCCGRSGQSRAGPSESGGGESTNEPSQQRTDRISPSRERSRCQFIGVMHLENFLPFLSLIPLPSTLCLECWLIGGRARDISVRSIHSNCPSLCRHKQRNKERTILSVGTISPSINEQLPLIHGTNNSTTFTTCADWTDKQAMDRVPIFIFFVLFFLAKRLIARHRQLHRRVRFALD